MDKVIAIVKSGWDSLVSYWTAAELIQKCFVVVVGIIVATVVVKFVFSFFWYLLFIAAIAALAYYMSTKY